jgi:hypothetical protein
MAADEPAPTPIDWDDVPGWLFEFVESPHVKFMGSVGQ